MTPGSGLGDDRDSQAGGRPTSDLVAGCRTLPLSSQSRRRPGPGGRSQPISSAGRRGADADHSPGTCRGPHALRLGAMEDEQPDSLEGWVPVREDLFAEPERHRLRFLVAWNDAEGQFAVTCHDRTAQRRRREGSQRAAEAEPGPEAAAPPPSWAGLLSAAGLRGAHRQLAALWPPLERCFPLLPPELDAGGGGAWGLRLGLWELVWPVRRGPGEAALQELCAQLERYLGEAAGGCGAAAVRDALFPTEGGAADCESPRAFRERALRARRAEADARLRQVRGPRGGGASGGGAGRPGPLCAGRGGGQLGPA